MPVYPEQIRIDLIPDHLQTRVRLYLPYVEKASRIYEVAPELILAVIQTESVFNPRAVSNACAVGLMQLVPSAGALEARSRFTGSREGISSWPLPATTVGPGG